MDLFAADVFAGMGGLTAGARAAGYRVGVAVELDEQFSRTYSANFPDARVIQRDVRLVTGGDLLVASPTGRIDLLMGCAPCQGFCSLTRKDDDPRNDLVLEMARLVEETKPTAVLMENVPGLATKGKKVFDEFLFRLRATGYNVGWSLVQMADYGVPQYRRRLVLIAGLGFDVPLPRATHKKRAENDETVRPWRTVRDAIYGEPAPMRLREAWRRGGPKVLNWHVVRDLEPQTRARLRAAAAGGMRMQLAEELLPKCHHNGYDGFRNVYMRMAWNAVSPTITAGCTTPAKGRFGHPDRRRTTISIREAATLQTFPKCFKLDTDKIEVAAQLIGNAVPPLFARKITTQIRKVTINRATMAG